MAGSEVDEGILIGIAELAELLGTSKSSLRYYEREGLIKPERAGESGYRKYSLQSIIELSDIVLYRNLGIPVKEIRRLLDSPMLETVDELDRAESELLSQTREIMQTLERISVRRRRIRAYQQERAAGYRFVEGPDVERLFEFDLGTPHAMQLYLSNPEVVRYAAFFPDARDARTYEDCSMAAPAGPSSRIVWSRGASASSRRWLTCLLKTAYSLTEENDMDKHVAYLESEGFSAGRAIAEYLTFDWDNDHEARADYYRLWLEAL